MQFSKRSGTQTAAMPKRSATDKILPESSIASESVPEEDVVDNNRNNSYKTKSPTKTKLERDDQANQPFSSDYSIGDDSEDGVSIIFKT